MYIYEQREVYCTYELIQAWITFISVSSVMKKNSHKDKPFTIDYNLLEQYVSLTVSLLGHSNVLCLYNLTLLRLHFDGMRRYDGITK